MPYAIASNASIQFSMQTAQSASRSVERSGADSRPPTAPASMDKVSISKEALEKAKQAADTEAADKTENESSWTLRGGLSNGEKTLDNGHRQVVKVDGAHLEIREYDGDRLVKSVKGEIGATTAVLDTEIYDRSGKVSQTIHTELKGLGAKDDRTTASMTRDIEWFDHGNLTRRMHDGMRLDSTYKGGVEKTLGALPSDVLSEATKPLPTDYDAYDWTLSLDTHHSDYFATIEEYDNDKLMRETVISQKSLHENQTNRTMSAEGDLPAWSTQEVFHDVNLSIATTQYDGDGNIVRQATFTDDQADGTGPEGGVTRQNISVSWYNDGELLQRSSGTLALQETAETKLSQRPSLMEILGFDAPEEQAEYSGATPQTAEELLSSNLLENATTGEAFGKAARRHASVGDYGAAEKIAEYGAHDQPYSISWSDELYKDGELAARRENREEALKNPLPKHLEFHTAGALTEDKTPSTLRRTEHVGESYENGRLAKRQFSRYREFVNEVDKGADALMTATLAGETSGGHTDSISNTLRGGLDEFDTRARFASTEMGTQVELTLQDFMQTMRTVRRGEPEANGAERLIRYTPS